MEIIELEVALAKFNRAELGFFPTPFYKLENLSRQLGITLFIKRDDFTGQNLFGGNKIRKLEFLLGEAIEKKAEYVFTYGATQSNHAMQTAAACCKLGIKPVLYLLDFVGTNENEYSSNLLLDNIFGAEINLVRVLPGEGLFDCTERYMQLANKEISRLKQEGHACLSIPLGGANELGTLGFVAGFVEMVTQMKELNISADYIFHANGSGGTMVGLNIGKMLLHEVVKIISVDAAPHGEDFLENAMDLATKTLRLLGRQEQFSEENFMMESEYFAPGYEKPSIGGTEAIKLLARQEGILLDPVYSGKAFAGLIDHVRNGKIAEGSNVIFWHTGGATALFAEKEILGEI